MSLKESTTRRTRRTDGRTDRVSVAPDPSASRRPLLNQEEEEGKEARSQADQITESIPRAPKYTCRSGRPSDEPPLESSAKKLNRGNDRQRTKMFSFSHADTTATFSSVKDG